MQEGEAGGMDVLQRFVDVLGEEMELEVNEITICKHNVHSVQCMIS